MLSTDKEEQEEEDGLIDPDNIEIVYEKKIKGLLDSSSSEEEEEEESYSSSSSS